jgi:hypothetical protein
MADHTSRHPSPRRYPAEMKQRAVRIVFDAFEAGDKEQFGTRPATAVRRGRGLLLLPPWGKACTPRGDLGFLLRHPGSHVIRTKDQEETTMNHLAVLAHLVRRAARRQRHRAPGPARSGRQTQNRARHRAAPRQHTRRNGRTTCAPARLTGEATIEWRSGHAIDCRDPASPFLGVVATPGLPAIRPGFLYAS